MLPRHLERSLTLLLDGPMIWRGDRWRQERPDPDASPLLVGLRNETVSTLFALRLVRPLAPARSLPRIGLSEAGHALAAGIALRLRAEMAELITTQIVRAAKALQDDPPPSSTDGRSA